ICALLRPFLFFFIKRLTVHGSLFPVLFSMDVWHRIVIFVGLCRIAVIGFVDVFIVMGLVVTGFLSVAVCIVVIRVQIFPCNLLVDAVGLVYGVGFDVVIRGEVLEVLVSPFCLVTEVGIGVLSVIVVISVVVICVDEVVVVVVVVVHSRGLLSFPNGILVEDV
ncbi:hypothetical protein HF521_019114, partial [Silurus meridionalis]